MNQPRKDPLTFVLFESPFTSVSTASRGLPSLVSLNPVIQAEFSVHIQVGKTTHHPAVPWDLPAGRAADPGRPCLLLCGGGGAAPGGDRPPHHLSPALPTRWINFFSLCTTLQRNFDLCFPINETAGPRSQFLHAVTYLWAIYIFPGSVCLFGYRKLGRTITGNR
jgi:hypothetical protein